MSITNLTLQPGDWYLPCPFCSSCAIELQNSHTASYWIECECGAQVHGQAFGTDLQSHKIPRALHEQAKATALRAWNTRYGHVVPAPPGWPPAPKPRVRKR